ncbi:MAG TPA: N-acetylmuramic acid 6-phosphate etherase [Phycisphaerae bacterium]|jgi:N-acetylmuramic acid 6-phosphate etherase|nr:N-acetylmuramic acid 6-phosphate etherase [Phycisphaerae bacterium]
MLPDRSHIFTEQSNPASERLDMLSIPEAVALMNAEDARMVAAVAAQREAVAVAVAWVAEAFRNGGRLIYIGAGTSGRLGVLDASECPPTFCSDPAMVVGIIAGGDHALRHSIENVEDDRALGQKAIVDLEVTEKDVVLGIAAGGTTPYVHAALEEAHDRAAKTIFLICTDPSHVKFASGVEGVPDLFIAVEAGPEVLTGSTRMKAGTATKLILNTITTLAMVQIGKTYGNLMIDIDATKNAKLTDRAARILCRLTDLGREEALELLEKSGGKVKHAVVMQRRQCDVFTADNLLKEAGGKLRAIIG